MISKIPKLPRHFTNSATILRGSFPKKKGNFSIPLKAFNYKYPFRPSHFLQSCHNAEMLFVSLTVLYLHIAKI